MIQKIENRSKFCAFLCAALLLIILILQFTPFWQYGEQGELSSSIGSYIWFPSSHKDLTTHFEATVREDYSINQILATPIILLILGAASMALCLIKPDFALSRLAAGVCGLVGAVGYLSEPIYKLGGNWGIHMVLFIMVAALGIGSFIDSLRAMKKSAE